MGRKERKLKEERKKGRERQGREGGRMEGRDRRERTRRKREEEKGKVRWRVEEKDGGGKRGGGGRKEEDNKLNDYNPRCGIVLAARSSCCQMNYELVTTKLSVILDRLADVWH